MKKCGKNSVQSARCGGSTQGGLIGLTVHSIATTTKNAGKRGKGMRLIDADELRKVMCADCDNKHLCTESPACDTVREIASMPTIEAEKHGRWLPYTDKDGKFVIGRAKCSVCGGWYEHILWVSRELNYCPNCGSRMDNTPTEKVDTSTENTNRPTDEVEE